MKTAVAMVTLGPDSWTRRYSVPRARAYAERYGYDFVQLSDPIDAASGRTPHWEKLLIPRAFPGYDRYFIIDDDVLINTRLAPALPDLPKGSIGMVREPVSTRFDPPMEWLGNSGVLLFCRDALDLLEDAYALGEYREIEPGFGDQPALNRVAWDGGRVTRLGLEWNYIAMADWLHQIYLQEHPWTKNVMLARFAKLTLMARLLLARIADAWRVPGGRGLVAKLRESYCIHLVWFRMGASLVDAYLG